jgi:hypothetical protein
MCGRFTPRASVSDLVEIFALLRDHELTPRFNIVPLINARADTIASRVCLRSYLLCFGAKIGRVSKGKR